MSFNATHQVSYKSRIHAAGTIVEKTNKMGVYSRTVRCNLDGGSHINIYEPDLCSLDKKHQRIKQVIARTLWRDPVTWLEYFCYNTGHKLRTLSHLI